MSQARGANAQVIIQEETTFKTDPGSPDAQSIPFFSCGLQQRRDQEQSQTLTGDRNPSKALRGNTDVGGALEVELQAYTGLLFKAALGDVATTGADPYIHTFSIGDTLPSLMIEKGFGDIDQYFKYNGCKVNSLSLSITASGFQNCSFDFVGAKETTGASSFDSTPTDLGKQSFDGFAIATIEEGGVAIGNVISIDSLTISNDLDTDQYSIGGAGQRDELPEGLVSVTGTLTARFEDLTLYNKAVNDTESSLKIIYTLGTGVGSAGNEQIEFLIPELTFAPQSPAISGPKGIMVELPFIAYYGDGSEGSTLQITLKNTQASI